MPASNTHFLKNVSIVPITHDYWRKDTQFQDDTNKSWSLHFFAPCNPPV